jgi:hypothetical protein
MSDEKEIFRNCLCHDYVMGELEKRIATHADVMDVDLSKSSENVKVEVGQKQYVIMELQDLKENL